MEQGKDNQPSTNQAGDFSVIKEKFRQKGLLDKELTVHHQGKIYHICCDERRFLVWRKNENNKISPGIPGWPVCLIKEDYRYHEEHLSGSPGFLAAGMDVEHWVELALSQAQNME